MSSRSPGVSGLSPRRIVCANELIARPVCGRYASRPRIPGVCGSEGPRSMCAMPSSVRTEALLSDFQIATRETCAVTSRWVLHVDLDQFLVAVEVLRHPELAGRAVIVGGDGDPSKRGVVATASYEARALGVGSGTPLRTAAKRIPDAVFLPVDKAHYEAVSAEVMAARRSVTVEVEELGWDGAFLGGADPPGD